MRVFQHAPAAGLAAGWRIEQSEPARARTMAGRGDVIDRTMEPGCRDAELPNAFRPRAHSDMERQNSYNYEQLIACARGELFGAGNARLPLPPMLMVDRITHIGDRGGVYGKGLIEAELDVHPGLWFFDCHFQDDPVMPGCLGLDAMWQLIGFYLAWLGEPGRGRALGVGAVKFTGQVLPDAKRVHYHINIKRLVLRRLVMGIADATLDVDGRVIYQATDLKVGLFTGMDKLTG